MAWKLFLDDVRFPYDVNYDYSSHKDLIICRSMDDAVWACETYGIPYFISFDHDLAKNHYIVGHGDKTGYDFAKWFCDHVQDNKLKLPSNFNFICHSMNPVGKKNIEAYMINWRKFYEKNNSC